MKVFDSNYVKLSRPRCPKLYFASDYFNEIFDSLKSLDYSNVKQGIPRDKGIYFWFVGEQVNYIGIAKNRNGLYGRVALQHLNEKYLEFRESKQNPELDKFQLSQAVPTFDAEGNAKIGIDKSTFRKKIGRKFKLKPGSETVSYIKENGTLKFTAINNIEGKSLDLIEATLIAFFQPPLNTTHTGAVVTQLSSVPVGQEVTVLK